MRYKVVLTALSLSACTFSIPRETPYPGSGLGKIERGARSKPSLLLLYEGSFHYQIRAKDGTLHILANKVEFQIGDCVAFSGYADGPSRTHWSSGRTTLVRSTDCDW